MTINHAKTSAAGASSDPTKVGGDDWNADHVIGVDGLAFPLATSTPATPSTGNLRLYAQPGLALPAVVSADGRATPLQPHLGRRHITTVTALAGQATFHSNGLSALVSGVTVARTTPTSGGTTLQYARRAGVTATGTAATGMSCSLLCYQGTNLSRNHTFSLSFRVGSSDTNTLGRSFYGICNGLLGNANPSAMGNMIGIGTDAGDTTFSVLTANNTSTTKIPLGANFPDHTGVDLYEVTITSIAGDTKVSIEVLRVGTAYSYRADITATVPAVSALMAVSMCRNNSTATIVPGFDLSHIYLETEL